MTIDQGLGDPLVLMLAQMVRFCLKSSILTMRRCRVPVYVTGCSESAVGLEKIRDFGRLAAHCCCNMAS